MYFLSLGVNQPAWADCVRETIDRALLDFQLDMREQLSVTDFRGREVGYLNVSSISWAEVKIPIVRSTSVPGWRAVTTGFGQ